MSKKSSERPTIPILGPIVGWFIAGPLRGFGPLFAAVVFLVGGGFWAWREQAEQVAAEPRHQISLEEITLSPPLPEWITTDLKSDALRSASLDPPLSALDPQLAERTAQAYAAHPWVARVRRVRTTAPGGLQIELDYRRPVCMVELPPVDGKRGLYAVDVEGTLLPSRDFLDEPRKAGKYPRLGGFTPAEVGRVGSRWPDARIVGGARIALVLTEVWEKLKLVKIVPQESASAATDLPTFELLTREGSRIVWGHAPGKEAVEEMTAERKTAALVQYAADHGTLEGREGPQQLDLSGRSLVVVAEKPEKPSAKEKAQTERKPKDGAEEVATEKKSAGDTKSR